MAFWEQLFSGEGFMPRRYCGVWSDSLIALHVVSDVIIWLSYLWIPLVMIWAYRSKRSELQIPPATRFLLLLYAVFITACGFTHFFDALMFWDPAYRINGLVRALTAVVSFATAVSLVKLIPIAVTAPITIQSQLLLLQQQQDWLRDILDSATGGVLRLCRVEEDLPAPLADTPYTLEIRSPKDLGGVRRIVNTLATAAGFARERTDGLTTATHEAAMNALRHAGGGVMRAYQSGETVQVWITDTGSGIPLDKLPIATLKQGYSTQGTAGQGWFLVLTFVDAAYLWTGPAGTTVVLTANRLAPEPVIPFSEWVGGEINSPYPTDPSLRPVMLP